MSEGENVGKTRVDRYRFLAGRTAAEMIAALQQIPGDTLILDIEESEQRTYSQWLPEYEITAEREIQE